MIYRLASKMDIDQLAGLFDNYRVFYKKASDTRGAICFISERIEQSDSTIFVSEDH